MPPKIPPHLRELLRLKGEGHLDQRIAAVLGHSLSTITTYTRELKALLRDEPEMQNPHLSSRTALMLIAQRLTKAPEPSSSLLDLVDAYTETAHTIYLERVRGNPYLALENARTVSRTLAELAQKYQLSPAGQEFQRIRGEILVELIVACNEAFPLEELVPLTLPILRTLRRIAKQCESNELLGVAYFLSANNYQLLGQHRKSAGLMTRALENIQDVDKRIWVLRGFILDCAHLRETNTYQRAVDEAKSLIDEGKFPKLERVCEIYEVFGRCQAIVGSTDAYKSLDEGWRILSEMEQRNEKIPCRIIQLARGELQVAKYLGKDEARAIEQIGNRGLAVARQLGYPRFEQWIESLLDELLN